MSFQLACPASQSEARDWNLSSEKGFRTSQNDRTWPEDVFLLMILFVTAV